MEYNSNPLVSIRAKILRKIKKLGIEQVAEKIGATIHQYRVFESDNKPLSTTQLKKLSEILGEDLSDMKPEIIIQDESLELTKIPVKQSRQTFIHNFIKKFINLGDNSQDVIIQLLKDIERS